MPEGDVKARALLAWLAYAEWLIEQIGTPLHAGDDPSMRRAFQ